MAKRLIMCCDGTWNTAGQKSPTNVVRLYNAVASSSADGTVQRAFYHEGVGTQWWDRIRGGAFGFGLSAIVQDAYRIVMQNYEVGDELFLFGFSRGAFTARSTAGFIRNAGILRPDQIDRIDEAYALYRNADGPDSAQAKKFRADYSVSDLTPIRFIGVWDTVGALGVPNVGLPGTNFLNQRWAFHDVKLSSSVQAAYQALSIDEARRPFEPAVWEYQPHSVGQQLEQVWFSGVHCDVGGGYPQHELADLSFAWMVARAQANGLTFKDGLDPVDVAVDALGDLHDSRTGMYKLLKPFERTIGVRDPQHEYAASSAVRRRDGDTAYKPAGLATYLGGTTHQEMQI